MHKTTLATLVFIISAILSGYNTIAQNQIPNADFESWTGNVPTSWDTSNEVILGTSFVCVTKDVTNPQSGTSSAKVRTVTNNIFIVGPVTMPGILTLGDVVIDILNGTGSVEGGVPVSGYPKFLKGYFKYTPVAGDSCIMGIGLTRWNGTSSDTVAFAYKSFGDAVTTWQEFSIPIEYTTWIEPDSMNIMFVSSNILFGSPIGGSTMWVDNLWLEYSQVSVNEVGFNRECIVYESSDGSSLIVSTPGNKARKIELFSLNGTLVQSIEKPAAEKTAIPINNLTTGVYIARVHMQDGSTRSVKFARL
jgi:hypothetical protein